MLHAGEEAAISSHCSQYGGGLQTQDIWEKIVKLFQDLTFKQDSL